MTVYVRIIGHNYVGHNYVGHNYVGHNYFKRVSGYDGVRPDPRPQEEVQDRRPSQLRPCQ